jgi:hypothetical protein
MAGTPDAGPPPKPPLDPNPYLEGRRFWVDIDWSMGLSEEAARRIGKELRRAVFAELGQLESISEIVIREMDYGGSLGIQISHTRG